MAMCIKYLDNAHAGDPNELGFDLYVIQNPSFPVEINICKGWRTIDLDPRHTE
jgi:hypothetical protein